MLGASENCWRTPPAERTAEARLYRGSLSTTHTASDGSALARWYATEAPTTPPPATTTSYSRRSAEERAALLRR
eukprot:scaffold258316_cov28-Tisochrysis_lutea.AAC.3